MAYNNSEIQERQPLSNARLGVLVLLGAETMLFSGLSVHFSYFEWGMSPGPRHHISGLNCHAW